MSVPPSCLGKKAPDLSADEGTIREPGLPELTAFYFLPEPEIIVRLSILPKLPKESKA